MCLASGGGLGYSQKIIKKGYHVRGVNSNGDEMSKVLKESNKMILPEDAITYGCPSRIVCAKTGRYDLGELKVQPYGFVVPDNEFGVKAVAAALGHGMSNVSRSHDAECVAMYEKYGLRGSGKTCSFEEPILLLADETRGYRAAWGGVAEEARLGCWYTCQEAGWTVDLYKLRPGLPDGGALVQSKHSAAATMARKIGDKWAIVSAMPVLPNGQRVGKYYESAFRGALNRYVQQMKY